MATPKAVARSRKLREAAQHNLQQSQALREEAEYLKFQIRQCISKIDLPNKIAERKTQTPICSKRANIK